MPVGCRELAGGPKDSGGARYRRKCGIVGDVWQTPEWRIDNNGGTVTRARDRAVEGRNDLSRFVVHLTRDDTGDFDDGQSARENFEDIAGDRKILALRPHCLHKDKIPEEHRNRFAVCCFMEVPLPELHLMTRPIWGRRVQYSDYGFAFSREFLVAKGAQPAIYVNSYGGNLHAKEAANEIYEIAAERGFCGKLSRLLPYLNAMHEGYDFAWEREWRVVGNLEFEFQDIACAILPEEGEDELKRQYMEGGVPVISPGWTAERIVVEFSEQARKAREVWLNRKRPRRSGKRVRRAA